MTPLPQSGTSEASSSTTRTYTGNYASLAAIGEFVRGEAKRAGLDDTAVYQVEMAVDEACSNIIEHAYGGEGKGEIECTCRNEASRLVIVLHDQGQAFKPEDVKPPDLKASLEDREAHGLGLFFIHEWMDQVDYLAQRNSGNTLTLVKLRGAKKASAKK